ncbi:hypothetical protein GCK32_021347, partial [Trichostrongylus colubriformis]
HEVFHSILSCSWFVFLLSTIFQGKSTQTQTKRYSK